mmetsp:Transcript_18578/g.53053  ORF Transcript_18578/g.53053 Transcript_18578/m.53053 type:complete len:395 (+) Transcript_18578:636-1820(+)
MHVHLSGVDAQNLGARRLVRMGKLDLAIQPSGSEQGGIQDVGPIGGGNHLDHFVGREAVELRQQFQHRSLHFAVSRLVAAKSLRSDGVNLVDEEDGAVALPGFDLCLGKLEGIPDELGAVADEHLHELRAGQLEEDGVGLVRARTRQQRLSGSRRSVQQNSLGRTDADGIEHVLVRHGQHDCLDQFLDLLVGTADVGILLRGTLVDLHGLNSGIEFFRQLFQDEVGILVGADEVGRLQLLGVDETRNWEEDGLPRGRSDDGRPDLALGLVAVPVVIFLQHAILSVRLQDLDDVGHQVRQLLVELDLFLVLANPLPLASGFVRDALHVGLHDADVVVDEVGALPQLPDAHVPSLVVLHIGLLRFFGRVAAGVVVAAVRGGAASVAPDVVSFQVFC